jgi:hypothetical protein
MAYVRKTRDEFQLHVRYPGPHGWEHELSFDTLKELREAQREYRDNCPEYPTKRVKRRVRIQGNRSFEALVASRALEGAIAAARTLLPKPTGNGH